MLFHPDYEGTTTEKDRSLYFKVIEFSMTFSDHAHRLHKKNGKKWHITGECHTICRCISHFIKELRVVDGNYFGIVQNVDSGKTTLELTYAAHSWLVTPNEVIIDPYPVGMFSANPVMVFTKGNNATFGGGHYIPDPTTTREHVGRKVARQTQVFIRLAQQALANKK